jgi:hypothetical protein
MADETMIIPVSGYMRLGADGKYHIVPELSEYVTTTPEVVARFLMRGCPIPRVEQFSGAVRADAP